MKPLLVAVAIVFSISIAFAAPDDAPIKVGLVVSEFTADGPNPLDNGEVNNYTHVTTLRPHLDDPSIELYAVIEPGTATVKNMPKTLEKYFASNRIIEVNDSQRLQKLDVIVMSRCWNLRPEMIEGVTNAVENGTALFLHEFNGGHIPGFKDKSLQKLLGIQRPRRFLNRSKQPAVVVGDHPLLFGVKPDTKLNFAGMDGAMGAIPDGVGLIAAPGATSGKKVKSAELPATEPTTSPSVAADVFYPLYVTPLGKGTVVGCQWDEVPLKLNDATRDHFYVKAIKWLAHRPTDDAK